MALDSLKNGMVLRASTLGSVIKANPIKSAAILGGTGIVVGGTALALKKSSSTRRKRTKRSWQLDRKRRSKQKWEVAYQRRKKKKASAKKSHKGKKVYYARKTGQPYIKLKNGQARFIKGKRRKR